MAKQQKATPPIGTAYKQNRENAFAAAASSNTIDECANYVDSHDEVWTWLAKIDAGNCSTYEQREHLHEFCHENGFKWLPDKLNADGTLPFYFMACKECVKCSFRAVYVVERGAVCGFHGHSDVEKNQMRPKESMFFKTNLAKMKTPGMIKAIAPTVEFHLVNDANVNETNDEGKDAVRIAQDLHAETPDAKNKMKFERMIMMLEKKK
ncbi:hypothetical protein niasHT_006277 [Heterodera trifolii]|uniref:Uncharacterized protein n=1 Tax=Heterodera trifolii TaxID=157864 RepID=A0ABD2M3Y9_9BILA